MLKFGKNASTFKLKGSPLDKAMTTEQKEDAGAQTNYKKDTEKKSGPDWSKAPKLNTQARRDWYTKNNLAQDKTTKVAAPPKVAPKKVTKVETKETGPKVAARTGGEGKPKKPSKTDQMTVAKREGGKKGRKVTAAERKLVKAAGDTSKRGDRKRRKAAKKLKKAGIA